MVDDRETVTFHKSAVRQSGEIGCGCLGAIAFIAAGLAMGDVLAFLLMGFFGLALGIAGIAELRRGTDTTLVQVGPDGIWLPGMDLRPWSDIAAVRLESVRGIAGADAPITKGYRRLGVVLRDSSIRPDAPTSLVTGMMNAYVALVHVIAPKIRLGGKDLAPFGVSELDLTTGFDRLLEVTRRHVEVIDAAERRAHEHAPRWAATGSSVPDLATLDARIGTAASLAVSEGLAAPGSLLPVASAAQPVATFVIPPIGVRDLASPLLMVAGPLLFMAVAIPASGGLVSGPARPFALLMLGIAVLWFIGPAAAQVVRLARRDRRRRIEPRLLEIGPDGMWLPEMGRVGWDRIGVVRTERAGLENVGGGAQVERWRLVVTPDPGTGLARPFGIDSDALEEPFDDVLDLVRCYHPVVETG